VRIGSENHRFLSDLETTGPLAPYQRRHPNGEPGVGVRTMELFPQHAYDRGTGYRPHQTINNFVV
jgi:hypothetical protein